MVPPRIGGLGGQKLQFFKPRMDRRRKAPPIHISQIHLTRAIDTRDCNRSSTSDQQIELDLGRELLAETDSDRIDKHERE
jgi:hypothetical protein